MQSIRYFKNDNHILVRDGIILAFFIEKPFHKIAEGIEKMLSTWLSIVSSATIKWHETTSSEHAIKFTNKTLSRCRTELDPVKAAKRELSGFAVFGEEEFNPSYQFGTTGSAELTKSKYCDETNLVEMRFPIDFFNTMGVDPFIDISCKMANHIPYDSGYASLSLNWSVDSLQREAAEKIVPIALRHPGWDVNANDDTRFKLGNRCRGARWLTFLGDSLVAKLGGREALAQKLDPGIQVLDAGAGIAIRAGAEPLPGDVNRKDTLPLICSVARAIEPVTYFKDKDMLQHMFNDDDTRLERWERRFLKDDTD